MTVRSISSRAERRLGGVLRRALLVLLLIFTAGAALAAADEGDLRRFAVRIGLKDVNAFVETITELRSTQRLPARYITKSEAERLGWRPGQDLCRIAPGRVIGGDTFLNAEGRLPAKEGRRYREADLDPPCGQRAAKRLVFSSDGLQFVTVDHYRTFIRVPD